MILQESYIHLTNLRFHARHGVMAQERLVGNDYVVSLRIGYDVSAAALSDDVDDTLDYAGVYRLVAREMGIPSQLVERVAYRIGESLCQRYPAITSIDVWVTKKNPPMGADCDGAGVELHLINDKTHP